MTSISLERHRPSPNWPLASSRSGLSFSRLQPNVFYYNHHVMICKKVKSTVLFPFYLFTPLHSIYFFTRFKMFSLTNTLEEVVRRLVQVLGGLSHISVVYRTLIFHRVSKLLGAYFFLHFQLNIFTILFQLSFSFILFCCMCIIY